MGAIPQKPKPLWIRANPRQLAAGEIEALRQTPHLADLRMPKGMFRALIRAGHRWSGELAYVKPEALRILPRVDPRELTTLAKVLAEAGIEIGSKARERVYVPSERS